MKLKFNKQLVYHLTFVLTIIALIVIEFAMNQINLYAESPILFSQSVTKYSKAETEVEATKQSATITSTTILLTPTPHLSTVITPHAEFTRTIISTTTVVASSTPYSFTPISFTGIDLNAVPPSDVLKQIYVGAQGGGGGYDPSRCVEEHDYFAPYPSPTIIQSSSALQTRPFMPGESRSSQPDICVCGFGNNEKLHVSLLDSASKVVDRFDVTTEQAKSLNTPLKGIFCAEIHGLFEFDFIPGDLIGQYIVDIEGSKSSVTYIFGLEGIIEPIIYYSDRLNGFVFAGFLPNESIRVLKFQKTAKEFKTYDLDYLGEQELKLDNNGIALLSSPKLDDKVIGAIRGSLNSEFFELIDLNEDLIDWDQILRLNPRAVNTHFHYAYLNNKIDAYSEVIKLAPNDIRAYYWRSKNLGWMRPVTETISDYSKIIELEPTFVPAYSGRADAYLTIDKFDLALPDANQIVKLDPELPQGYYYRGFISWQLKDYERAISDFLKVIELDPNYSEYNRWNKEKSYTSTNTYQFLGLMYFYDLQQKDIALEYFKMSALASPDRRNLYPIDNMPMVLIPEGDFFMGSLPTDPGAESIEQPQHKVYLDSYWMDQDEVTEEQYNKCVSAGACQKPNWPNSGFKNYSPNQPIIQVTWQDARDYCKWTGRRLPTEAEWEKAARGTDGRVFPWGNIEASTIYANYNSDRPKSGGFIAEESSHKTPLELNYFNVHDMAGNVWEWVNDYLGEDYYTSSPLNNPQGPETGDRRAMRGGAWKNKNPNFLRAANRWGEAEDYTSDSVGFRCALSAN